MNRLSFVALLVLVSLAIVLCPAARAQWVENGIAIAVADNSQQRPTLVMDDSGGAFIVWDDGRPDAPGIYVQRIDALGNPLWPGYGVLLSIGDNSQAAPMAISDEAGGAIIAWMETGISDDSIHFQKIDADGNTLWTPGGVVVTDFSIGAYRIVTDQAGGVISTWHQYVMYSSDIYAQRIDSDGNILWTTPGVPVCTADYQQEYPVICSDNNGGAFIAWHDLRSYTSFDIYVQRLNSGGTPVFPADGITASATTDYQYFPEIATGPGASCFIAFYDDRGVTGEWDIYAQFINSSGSRLMGTDGAAVCNAAGDQVDHEIIMDPASGMAIIAWTDYRTPIGSYYSDIYMQRITITGYPSWTANGIAVCTADGAQNSPAIVLDGFGGAMVAWFDGRTYSYDIYAQRIAGDSTAYWEADGVPILDNMGSARYFQTDFNIVHDDAGGLLACWEDDRYDGSGDVYAQRLWNNGNWGTTAPCLTNVEDVPGDQGGKIRISWMRSALDYIFDVSATQYSVWRRLMSSGTSMPSELSAPSEVPLPDVEQDSPIRILDGDGWIWEWLATIPAAFFNEYAYTAVSISDSTGLDTGWQYFMVRVHTSDPLEFYDSPVDSGYSVDNLAPSQPSPVSGEQNFDPEGLRLTWEDNEDPDLAHYNVYRGTGDDFNPVPGPEGKLPAASGELISSTQITTYFDDEWRWDSEYWYGIAAVDVNGNESELSLFGPGNVTGDDPMPLPDATFLAQNFPNPFNPNTTIAFGLKSGGFVNLSVYDAAGRLVATLINESRPAGQYTAVWNGKDRNGSNVASGVYFYRLITKESEETKKMILLK